MPEKKKTKQRFRQEKYDILDFLMIDLLFYDTLFKNYTKFARIKILL